MRQRKVRKCDVALAEVSVLVESLRSDEGHKVSVGNHGTLRWSSRARSVGKGKAIIGLDLEFFPLVIHQILLADNLQLRIGNQLNAPLSELLLLLLREGIETDESVDVNQVPALEQRLDA